MKLKNPTDKLDGKSYIHNLAFKTLVPLLVIIILIIGAFGFYLSTTTKNNSKDFLVRNVLMPEFGLLAKEKDNDFNNIKTLTEYTAQKIEERIAASKKRSPAETEALFNKYISKKPDGSYRSILDPSKGRFQMAAFHNNVVKPGTQEKNYFIDAFLYFDPLIEGMIKNVHDSYFTTQNFIWEYGAPEWPSEIPANETFDKYNWYYEADPEHNPEGKQIWTDMYYDDVQSEWMISSLMPIYANKEYKGTLGQDLILKKIIEITKRSNLGETGTLFFLDNLDNIVAHPDSEFLIGKKGVNDERLNLKTLSDTALTQALQNLPEGNNFRYTNEKNRRIVMFFPLESVEWKMVYTISEEDFLQTVTQTNQQYLFAFVIFATVVLVLIFLAIRFMVTRPIKKLTNVTRDMSEGNFDQEIDITSQDEIGELADSFKTMTHDLAKSRDELKKYGKNLEIKIGERTAELALKNIELEKANKFMVNRELEMVKLKKSIDQLKGTGGSKSV